MVKLLFEIAFYGLMIIVGIFSVLMIFVLLRFGKSKILGLIISAFYIILILSLYAAAIENFNNIPFSRL